LPEKKRVLWVEDSARYDYISLLGPVFASHRYDLTLAENVSTAAEYLRRRQFDAIIVDIRLPPGTHAYWRHVYRDARSDKTNAKLGLALLGWLLASDNAAHPGKQASKPPDRPTWLVAPERIAVFSVESRGEIGAHLEGLGVALLREKQPGLPDTVLLDLIDELLPDQPN
jgi:CheY-like chemotaxis protein